MAQLHETMYGRKLLEHDIPEIYKQLKRIADAMEKANQLKDTELKEQAFEKLYPTADQPVKP